MKTTGDLHLMKQINKTIVLDTIIRNSPISRAQISEMTGLNKGTVSSLVQELIDASLVCEIGPGQSSGGRKPVLLLFNQHAGYAIGVDLGVNYILTVLTDLQGDIVHEERLPLTDRSVPAVTSRLKESLRSAIGAAPESPYGIIGIGVGVPGLIDGKGGILFAPNLGWEHVDLGAMLRQEFSCPITIDNEANAGAIGEKQFGAGRSASDLIYVSIGMGIGTGIILNRELYRGSRGFSGEMGHISIDRNGKKCSCGNRGCWELYASEKALLDQARTLPRFAAVSQQDGETGPDIAALAKLAGAGDHDVIHLLNQIGEHLGVGLVNIMNTFNPELIVIGNRFTDLEPWLSKPLQRVVESRSLPYPRQQLKIEFSSLGTHSTALGAAFLAVKEFFSSTKVIVA